MCYKWISKWWGVIVSVTEPRNLCPVCISSMIGQLATYSFIFLAYKMAVIFPNAGLICHPLNSCNPLSSSQLPPPSARPVVTMHGRIFIMNPVYHFLGMVTQLFSRCYFNSLLKHLPLSPNLQWHKSSQSKPTDLTLHNNEFEPTQDTAGHTPAVLLEG